MGRVVVKALAYWPSVEKQGLEITYLAVMTIDLTRT
jgi:hypothetical protein